MLSLASRLVLYLGSLGLRLSSLRRPAHTADNIRHGATSVGAKDLDGDNVGLLRNTILTGSNSASAVGTVPIPVFINIIQGHSLSPGCTTFEFSVVDVDTGVDDVNVNALSTVCIIFVLGKGTESKLESVTDTC